MCPAATLARASLLLCLVVGSRQLSITELVVPSTVRAGESAELACRFDRGNAPTDTIVVKWWWTSANSTMDPIQIYQRVEPAPGQPVPHHGDIHHIQVKGDDTIVVPGAAPAVSGRYECEVAFIAEKNEEKRLHKNLVVYSAGSGPQLNMSAAPDGPDADEEEDVLVECRAHDVAPEPDLLLKISSCESFNATEEVIGPDAGGFYAAAVSATLSRHDVLGAAISCELFYKDASIAHEPYLATGEYVSGAPMTPEAPEEPTAPALVPEPLPTQSGDRSRASWAVLLALSLLTQAPSLL